MPGFWPPTALRCVCVVLVCGCSRVDDETKPRLILYVIIICACWVYKVTMPGPWNFLMINDILQWSVADKAADANLLWEKNTVPCLLNWADKLSEHRGTNTNLIAGAVAMIGNWHVLWCVSCSSPHQGRYRGRGSKKATSCYHRKGRAKEEAQSHSATPHHTTRHDDLATSF